jgi:regulator of ribonuclease activity A
MDISTADLYDKYGERTRVVAPALVHFGGRRRFQGEVVTIQCFEDNSRIRETVSTPGAGRVLVIDGGGSTRCALLGDMMGQRALSQGWVALVIFGCVRDSVGLATLELGVMALATTPRRSGTNGKGEVGVPVDLAGTPCNPGDFLFADPDGLLLVEPSVLSTEERRTWGRPASP